MRLMQVFYWDCPGHENMPGQWWNLVASKIPLFASVGITGLWLPPSHKASHIDSMGYAPYDYYDQGEYDQKGGFKTWFGSKAELKSLIDTCHDNGISVIADAVLNHCDVGDEKELNPLSNKELFTKYTPASGKFPRNWNNFHPSEYDWQDAGAFYGDLEGYWLPDLCHDNPDSYSKIMAYIGWLRGGMNGMGYDGFRYDAVKYFDSWIVENIQNWQKCFGIVEYWDGSKDVVKGYLNYISWTASAFDFPLFYTLRGMCNDPGFDMRWIWGGGLIFDIPMHSVTFCDNHDTDRSSPIVTDKLMAYAFILTHEGVPCVYWKDYFNYGLALPGTSNGIDRLCEIHRDYAAGNTSLLHADRNLYVAQRHGYGGKPGLMVAINNHHHEWRGAQVFTQWRNTRMECVAWWGHDMHKPLDKTTGNDGSAEFYAPPRGFAVYAPKW